MNIFKKACLYLSFSVIAAYPFIYNSEQSLLLNLGYYKIYSPKDNGLIEEQIEIESKYLDTAVHLIKRQRLSLLQQRNTILTLKESVHNRDIEIKNLQSSLDDTTAKIEDFLFAFNLTGNQGKPLSERLRGIELSALNRLMLNRLLPLSNVLKEVKITSHFGYRKHPITKTKKHHNGIDFAAPIGTPIFAPADGIVTTIKSTKQSKGSGNLIKIEHGMGFKTSYSHLSKILVSNNQVVSKGDIIGLTGNTGRSTGPHLHYEVLFLNKKINPFPLIKFAKNKDIEQLKQQTSVPWSDLSQNINEIVVKTALLLK